MDDFLDKIWNGLVVAALMLSRLIDALLAPLSFLGPAGIVFLLALITVLVSKLLTRHLTTRRYQRLEKEFKHWYAVKQTALADSDKEKGKAMARMIDKAELNQIYYDYFFEGLLLGIARKVLPFLAVFAYVNETFGPEQLQELLGRACLFRLDFLGTAPFPVHSILWYLFCLLVISVFWMGFRSFKKKLLSAEKT